MVAASIITHNVSDGTTLADVRARMGSEKTLYIKDGTVGRMYRLYYADESNYDHVATYVYRVNSEGRIAGYGTICDDETFLLLAKRTVPIISIDLVLQYIN